MAVLSQEKAKIIARKLCEKKKLYIDNLNKELSKSVLHEYEIQIPHVVSEAFKKEPKYFKTTMYIKVDGHGFNNKTFVVDKSVITNDGHGSNAWLKMDKTIASLLSKLDREVDKQTSEYKKLVQETTSSLLALKTTKNIADKFPEAAALMPVSFPVPVKLDVTSLRNKLAHQIPNK